MTWENLRRPTTSVYVPLPVVRNAYPPALYSLAECFPAISVPAAYSPEAGVDEKESVNITVRNTPVRYARGFTRVAELLTAPRGGYIPFAAYFLLRA